MFFCNSKRKGQLSIEYVLMLSVGALLLGILLSSYSFLYNAGEYANSVLNAREFSSSFSSACSSLSLLGEGSSFSLNAQVLGGSWKISNSGQKVIVLVQSKEGREKEFFFECPCPLRSFSYSLSKSAVFSLTKESGKLVLEKES